MSAQPANLPGTDVSAAGNLFETLLRDIVLGVYPPKARLPAERELARLLGASRPTLREALRRLSEWGLVEARRGSGVVVRDQRDWSLEVLPAYLKYGAATMPAASIVRTVGDMLALRRTLIVELVRMVAPRMQAERLAPARAALQKAWDARGTARFVDEDFNVMRSVAEAAEFMPAVWMLNRLAGVYLDIARSLATMPPPDDYLRAHERFLDALGRGNAAQAASTMNDYLSNHDRRLMTALEALT